MPGAFELPLAAKSLASTGRYAAIIALGVGDPGRDRALRLRLQRGRGGLTRGRPRDRRALRVRRAHLRDHEQAVARAGGDKGNAGADAADAAVAWRTCIADGR